MFEIALAARCERGQRQSNEDNYRCGVAGRTPAPALSDGAGDADSSTGIAASVAAPAAASDGLAPEAVALALRTLRAAADEPVQREAFTLACPPMAVDGENGARSEHVAGQAPTVYAVLADGAGGHVHGADASRRVVTHVEQALRAAAACAPATLDAAVHAAHRTLQDAQADAQGTGRMHATVVALWIDPHAGHAVWTHVGDSRLYRLRHGEIDHITRDDSVVQRMVDGGLLTREQARDHPSKNQLLAALGMVEAVQPHTVPQPIGIDDGDAYLLCTDGWWEPLGDAAIAASLSQAVGPQDWLDAMHRRIEALGRPRQDNYSAIAVWVGDPATTARFRLDDDEMTVRQSLD